MKSTDLEPDRAQIRLNRTDVEALAPGVKDYFVPIDGYRGLYVRALPNGEKSFVLRYRFNGVQRKHTLGRWPAMTPEAAKKAYIASWDMIHGGKDPNQAKADDKKAAREAKKAAVTVADLAERFIAEHIGAKITWKGESFKVELIRDGSGKPLGNKESTAREHIRLIHRNILPTLGKMPVQEVGTAEVSALLFKIRKEHPTQSNRVRSVLSKMFVKAELWEMRPAGSNPSRGQDRAPERKKDRHLNDREIMVLGAALRAAEEARAKPEALRQKGDPRQEDPAAIAALRLAILTGMRKSEIIGDRYRGIPGLTWGDTDLKEGILHVHHKTEGHTGKKRTVYLCAAAREILSALPHTLGNPHVIPGEKKGQSLVNLQVVWDRIRSAITEASKKEAQKTGKKTPAIDLSDVTLHDLRRTFSSLGARMGYPELWLGALLGHSAVTVTQGYARVNEDPLRTAVEAIGGRIAGLLAGTIDLEKEEADRRHGKEPARQGA